ncbi:D-lactate dehydrogenase [Mycobacterium intracellulare subsp. yongonense]|nr:D-lactate dehydrogenase [Mycobacterium intracellulare subsp. yongonense]ARR84924.1 hypothetical protein MOTT27_04103 [Mycobacterium intracellulare subsp. yongonense]
MGRATGHQWGPPYDAAWENPSYRLPSRESSLARGAPRTPNGTGTAGGSLLALSRPGCVG